MSPDIKVTDKRIFREDGELREEYRYLEDEGGKPPAAGKEEAAPSPPDPTAAAAARPEPAAPVSRPERPATLPAPRFIDLIGLLAEPAAIYLGDAPGPDDEPVENLPVARFHIDLLDVLREKTEGNLDPAERAVLEDVIYRLRLRYVEKTR